MSVRGAQESITQAVTAWAGVTVWPYRFGGVEYGIGKRESGIFMVISSWIFLFRKK